MGKLYITFDKIKRLNVFFSMFKDIEYVFWNIFIWKVEKYVLYFTIPYKITYI